MEVGVGREFWWEWILEQMQTKYYVDGLTLASMDVIASSLYIVWSGFWITRIWVEVQV